MSNTRNNEFSPNYAIPPGEILDEELQSRGMSQAELAQRTGLTPKAINELVKGKTSLTPESALKLERVFRQPAEYWLNLERLFQEATARRFERERQAENTVWLSRFPLRAMIKLGWVKHFKDPVDQMNELLSFFGIASPAQWKVIWDDIEVAYRKSNAFSAQHESLSAWLRQGELVAEGLHCSPFNAVLFREALNDIRALTRDENPNSFIPKLIRRCADCGVAVALVPELPNTHVSGATRWITKDTALIQLSFRYKSDDHFWFTFFHEAGHILKHGKKHLFIEDDQEDNELEREANIFANNLLIPAKEFKAFVTKKNFSKARVLSFAESLSIAPGIVVGRLQHANWIPHTHLNALKVRFRWSHESAK